MIAMTDRLDSVFFSAPWVRGRIFLLLVVLVFVAALVPAMAVYAQGADPHSGIEIRETEQRDTEVVHTVTGHVALTETSRKYWRLSETDWNTYTTLMQGPSGIWYPHLPPAHVLGINAATDAERDRYARIVFDLERRRLDDLFAFNRAYSRIAQAHRSSPGFGYFGEFADVSTLAGPGLSNIKPSRVLVFVGHDCPVCDRTVRELSDAGRPFDVYYVDAGSDSVISRWARRIGLPAHRVLDRTITLNHEAGFLGRSGKSTTDLPILFRDSSLNTPVTLETALSQ